MFKGDYILRINPFSGVEVYGLYVDGEREVSDGRRTGRDAPVVGAPGQSQIKGNQVRMRHRCVRRVHRAPRRQASAGMPDADFDGQGGREDHRRVVTRRIASVTESMAAGGRSTVRVLPGGTADDRFGSVGQQTETD